MIRGGFRGKTRGAPHNGRAMDSRGSRPPVASRLGLHPSLALDARDRLVMSKRNIHDARAFIRKNQFDKAGDLRAVLKVQESNADADISRELERVNAERGNIRNASDKMLLSHGSRNQHPYSKRGRGGIMTGKTLVISRQFIDAPPSATVSLPHPRTRSRSPILRRKSQSRSPQRPPPHEPRRTPPDDLPPYRDELYRHRGDIYRDLPYSGDLRYGHSLHRQPKSHDRGAPPRVYSPPRRDYTLDPLYRRHSRSPRRHAYRHAYRHDRLTPPEYYSPRRSSFTQYDNRYLQPQYDRSRKYSPTNRRGVLRDDCYETLGSRAVDRDEAYHPRRDDPFHPRSNRSPSPPENRPHVKSQVHVSPGYNRAISGNGLRGTLRRRSVSPRRQRSSREFLTRHRISRRISLSPTPERNRVTSTVTHRAGFANGGGEALHAQQHHSSQVASTGVQPLYKIRVANLDVNVNQDDIHELFSDIGKVKYVKMVEPGVAEVVYCMYDDVKKAIEAYNRRELDRRPMSVEFIGHV